MQQVEAALHLLMTGQVAGATLLKLALVLFVYFLPSFLAFNRARKAFWLIVCLNIVLTLAQSLIFHALFPSLFVLREGNVGDMLRLGALVNFGPGWLALLIWALLPGEPDPRLLKARDTKTYDVLAALPLILWFVYGALQLRPVLVRDGGMILAGTASLFIWVQFCALFAAALFDLLLVYLLIVRDGAVGKSRGVLPRACGVIGTFLGVGILTLPVARLSLSMQILAAVLIGLGSLGSVLVLWRLGKSFSILPEARKLVTGGPYAFVRHPLYSVEIVTIVGTALQFQGPWSWVIALGVMALLWIRSHYEEQVLAESFPEYGAYRARTKRFIPGVI
ncbi:MAG TPA: isoprenylcysteine carboxylmethyltransferase family protein [Rhizomicrobium sp.]|nr:isoprenylcysteine carboxylmethyltransferase family protein [Rhizomicrobium sp.]